jgi:predicted metal-dependent phosphoesterase TrpH
VLKAELHSHSADDPCDRIPYSTRDLIDRAATLGYQVLAVTLHERQLDLTPLDAYAAARGIVLIRGIERTVEGKHVLLLNFDSSAEAVHSFADVARLKARGNGVVIAPHPFFPDPSCLRRRLDDHADLFDAIEWNGMFTATLNFNARAERWAREHRKPMVGNGDVHHLDQLGTTWSLIDAPPTADAICAAIKRGAVRVVASPHSWRSAARIMTHLLLLSRVKGQRFKVNGEGSTVNLPLPSDL